MTRCADLSTHRIRASKRGVRKQTEALPVALLAKSFRAVASLISYRPGRPSAGDASAHKKERQDGLRKDAARPQGRSRSGIGSMIEVIISDPDGVEQPEFGRRFHDHAPREMLFDGAPCEFVRFKAPGVAVYRRLPDDRTRMRVRLIAPEYGASD